MKFLVMFFALFALSIAAPQRFEETRILRSDSDVGPDSFQYAYETSDGSKAEAGGVLTNVGSENEALVVRGYYSFVGDDGQTYRVDYVADENGFQPKGSHLPVA